MIHLNDPFDVERFQFPAGERGIRLQQPPNPGVIIPSVKAHLRSPEDLIDLVLLFDALRANDNDVMTLILPYLPYGRQDKVHTKGDPIAIRAIANILDNLGANTIETWDCHSSVTNVCFRNTKLVEKSVLSTLISLVEGNSIPTVIIPDLGAAKKIAPMVSGMYKDIIHCTKVRDPKTGKLSQSQVLDTQMLEEHDREFVIVDDICDGGKTFLNLFEEIRKYTLQPVSLVVTHAMFSNKENLKLMSECFKEIHTTDSWATKQQVKEYKNVFVTSLKL